MSAYPLRADTYRVGNRNYRRNPYRPQASRQHDSTEYGDTPDLYGDEPDVNCFYNPPANLTKLSEDITQCVRDSKPSGQKVKNDKCDKNNKVKTVFPTEDERIVFTDNKWTTEMYVPQCFLGKLIGIKGRTRMDIEKSTNCRLKIPRNEKDLLGISSFSGLEAIQICIDRIEMMLEDFRLASSFTHFVAYQLHYCPGLQSSFQQFKQEVLNCQEIPEETRNPNAFINEHRLHCSISMLKLLDSKEEQKANSTLQNTVRNFNLKGPIDVEVRGLSLFNDDPSSVYVVYANVHSDLFQQLANQIDADLRKEGFAFQDKVSASSDSVVIHMTLLNAKYVGRADGTNRRIPFDATELMKRFGNFNFGITTVDKIAINFFSSKEHGPYNSLFELSLSK